MACQPSIPSSSSLKGAEKPPPPSTTTATSECPSAEYFHHRPSPINIISNSFLLSFPHSLTHSFPAGPIFHTHTSCPGTKFAVDELFSSCASRTGSCPRMVICNVETTNNHYYCIKLIKTFIHSLTVDCQLITFRNLVLAKRGLMKCPVL